MSMNNLIDEKYKHNDYRRMYQVRALEKADNEENDEFYYLEGKAVDFDSPTILFKDGDTEYREIIDSDAFDGADLSDVFLKFNHSDHYMGVARTKNNTLQLNVRKGDGVYIVAKLSKRIKACEDLYFAVKEGLIDKMSFAFTIKNEDFETDTLAKTATWTVRQIDKVYDVAAVEVPAYENTYIYARRQGDVESRLKEVETSELERKRSIALSLLKN